MKSITVPIPDFQEDLFFRATREKTDYAKIVLAAARLLLLNLGDEAAPSTSQLKLIISKMSRLFVYKIDKYYSVAFPFNVAISDNQVLNIQTFRGTIVDSRCISLAFSFLENEQFILQPAPSLFSIDCSPIDAVGLSLLEEIFLLEPCYLRYDVDPEHENGNLHPLIHIDINYSSYGTYKLGVSKKLSGASFENVVDILTECLFLVEGPTIIKSATK